MLYDFEMIPPGSTVLVIGADYLPIHFSSWKRAMLLVVKEKAQIVGKQVIRLLKYVKIPFLRPKVPTRKLLFKRDSHTCQYCGKTLGSDKLTVDHIIPRSRGGKDDWENVVAACGPCNLRKGDRTPKEADMPLLSQPYAPFNKVAIEVAHSKNQIWKEYCFV
jgi:hypothetical protein